MEHSETPKIRRYGESGPARVSFSQQTSLIRQKQKKLSSGDRQTAVSQISVDQEPKLTELKSTLFHYFRC